MTFVPSKNFDPTFSHPASDPHRRFLPQGLDTRWAVAHSPKILQGIAAGVCDYFTFGLTLRAFGATAAGWALLFQVLSWFNFYCLVRPYSNSAEAVLATAALYFWAPFILPATATSSRGRKRGGSGGVAAAAADSGVEKAQGMESEGAGPVAVSGSRMTSSAMETVALLLAAFCVAVRPTSAALWVRMFHDSACQIRLSFFCEVRVRSLYQGCCCMCRSVVPNYGRWRSSRKVHLALVLQYNVTNVYATVRVPLRGWTY